VQLLSNLFPVEVKGKELWWYQWDVTFDEAVGESAPAAPAGVSKDQRRGPGAALRQEILAKAMSQASISSEDFVYDGNRGLFTTDQVRTKLKRQQEYTVQLQSSRDPIVFNIEESMDSTGGGSRQKCINLAWLGSDLLSRTSEEQLTEARRFMQIVLKTWGNKSDQLCMKGRTVVFLESPLLDPGERLLKYGREMWLGFRASLEITEAKGGKLRSILNLNLVASVGLPEMSAVDFLISMLAGNYDRRSGIATEENKRYYRSELEKGKPPRELSQTDFLKILSGPCGVKGLLVVVTNHETGRKGKVLNIADKPANRHDFEYDDKALGRKRFISVAEYFDKVKKKPLKYPFLPCLEITKKGHWIPMEHVRILGGEHNIMAGKLRPEYQQEVVRRAAMPAQRRYRGILDTMKHDLGPIKPFEKYGIAVTSSDIRVTGRQLDTPILVDAKGSKHNPNGYGPKAKAFTDGMVPPSLRWGMWSYARAENWQLQDFARSFKRLGQKHGLNFEDAMFIENKSSRNWKEAIRDDIEFVSTQAAAPHVLFVVLPSDGQIHGWVKFHTEMCGRNFSCRMITQCMKYEGKEVGDAKFDKIAVKVAAKMGCYHVRISNLHPLLGSRPTMVMGADVTHNAAGVSVAAVVASADQHFQMYDNEIRAQSPWDQSGERKRQRKSEERILDLSSMSVRLLQRWKRRNNRLPEVILYYRDGVSDGQFMPVLTMELNELAKAFEEISKTTSSRYNPSVVIIVGQKRHHTRFFPTDGEERAAASADKGKGDKGKGGKDDKGKGGKGGGKVKTINVNPGTVVSEGVSLPGHPNFYLVSHSGGIGCSVPCHYHVLHMDKRLVERKVSIDDIEMVTYQLCHLYSRADMTVSYASPAYLADHAAERGKAYLECHYQGGEIASVAGSGSSAGEDEQEIRRRVSWLNAQQKNEWLESSSAKLYFC